MCNIEAVMHWCFDFTNKCHSNYFLYIPLIGYMDWIGFGSAFRSSLWIGSIRCICFELWNSDTQM